MAIKTIEEKVVHDISDMYDAEHRFLEGQHAMLQMASTPQLQKMLQEHAKQTEQHIQTLEQVYQILGHKPKRSKCDAAAGLVAEGEKATKEMANNPALLDWTIAGAAAKIEHYEIASYRALVTACEELGMAPVVQLLEQTLEQEHMTAQKIEKNLPILIQQAMTSVPSVR
jgi:ferritin-like metal-binding protein YciE